MISKIFPFLFLALLNLCASGCTLESGHQKIESWHQLRAAGDVALAKHDYQTAEKSFRAALKIAETLPSQPVRQAVSLEDLSRVCLALDDKDLAATIEAQALALASKRSLAPKRQSDVLESSLAQSLNNCAAVLVKAKKYDQAAIANREARALFVDLYKRSPIMVSNLIIGSCLGQTIDNLGISYKELGQLKEARQAYLSVAEEGIVKGLPLSTKQKLLEDYCQIPDTPQKDKVKYAAILGCMLLPNPKMNP